MLNNQLESLESVAYAKLAEFIQSERLSEAGYLVDIICRIPNLSKGRNNSILASMLDERRVAEKIDNYAIPFNYGSAHISNSAKAGIQPQAGLGKVTLDGYASTLPTAAKPSEYTWNDGSKDPREDYWRDG